MAKSNANESRSSFMSAKTLLSKLPSFKTQLLYWLIVIIGVTADLWTKKAVFDWLPRTPNIEFSVIDGFLRLILRENAGAAFSIASGQYYFLIGVSSIALVVVIGMFLFSGTQRAIGHIALALFTAGIIGNLHDRIFNNGFVRDFIDVYYQNWHWPAFNVADSMLCIAVGLIILGSITSAACQKPAHRQK